jgi:hypothetical protein
MIQFQHPARGPAIARLNPVFDFGQSIAKANRLLDDHSLYTCPSSSPSHTRQKPRMLYCPVSEESKNSPREV